MCITYSNLQFSIIAWEAEQLMCHISLYVPRSTECVELYIILQKPFLRNSVRILNSLSVV